MLNKTTISLFIILIMAGCGEQSNVPDLSEKYFQDLKELPSKTQLKDLNENQQKKAIEALEKSIDGFLDSDALIKRQCENESKNDPSIKLEKCIGEKSNKRIAIKNALKEPGVMKTQFAELAPLDVAKASKIWVAGNKIELERKEKSDAEHEKMLDQLGAQLVKNLELEDIEELKKLSQIAVTIRDNLYR